MPFSIEWLEVFSNEVLLNRDLDMRIMQMGFLGEKHSKQHGTAAVKAWGQEAAWHTQERCGARREGQYVRAEPTVGPDPAGSWKTGGQMRGG